MEVRPTVGVRLNVHDASRLEWMVELPIPADGSREEFDLDLRLEVPAHVWTAHDHWEHLQVYARLASPSEDVAGTVPLQIGTVDELRRATLAAVHRLKVVRDRLETEIFGAASMLSKTARASLGDDLLSGLHSGLSDLKQSRGELCRTVEGESAEITRERGLAAEFLSNHVLNFLSKVARAIDEQLCGPRCRHRDEYEEVARKLRPQLARALADELSWRAERALARPDPDDVVELERYVERASTLKKHFQEVLFLKLSQDMVDRRLRNWLGSIAAMLAAFWAFPLGVLLTTDRMAGVGVGFFATLLLFAVMYAVKDRIKELVRGWLTDKVTRGYAGRVTTMESPVRLLSTAAKICKMRENFLLEQESRPDPLNPELGATRKVVVLRYHAKGEVTGDTRLAGHHIERTKLVFRYDLSELFTRLDDATKRVPVLAADGKSVRFAEATRAYRMPLSLCVRYGPRESRDGGLLVTHKLGLERVERPMPMVVAAEARSGLFPVVGNTGARQP